MTLTRNIARPITRNIAQSIIRGTGSTPAFDPRAVSGFFLEHDSTNGVVDVGGVVTQWNDISGNGYNSTQGTSGQEPTTGTRTMNGANAVDFDGSNDHMDMNSALYTVPAGNNTVFILYQSDDISGDQRIFTGSNGGSRWYMRHDAATGTFSVGSRSAFSSIAQLSFTPDTNPHVGVIHRDGGNVIGYYDGTPTANNNTANDVTVTDVVFGALNGGGLAFDGLIRHMFIYNEALSLDDLNGVGNFLADEAGITWNTVT